MEGKRKNHRRNIVAVSMVKNEMDIIESFVRHTLTFADRMIIADHQSTDRTRDILGQLQAEGLPIVIETIYTARYAQAEVTTRLMHEAADVYDADLILPLDADEFIVPRGGHPSARSSTLCQSISRGRSIGGSICQLLTQA